MTLKSQTGYKTKYVCMLLNYAGRNASKIGLPLLKIWLRDLAMTFQHNAMEFP